MSALRLPFLHPAVYGSGRTAARGNACRTVSSAPVVTTELPSSRSTVPRPGLLGQTCLRAAPSTAHAARDAKSRRAFTRGVATSTTRQINERPQRYGKANEPPAHLKKLDKEVEETEKADAELAQKIDAVVEQGKKEGHNQARKEVEDKPEPEMSSSKDAKIGSTPSFTDGTDSVTKAGHEDQVAGPQTFSELRTVLEIPPPDEMPDTSSKSTTRSADGAGEEEAPADSTRSRSDTRESQEHVGVIMDGINAHPPPKLTPPRYVHHFDSYTAVKDLQSGGFSQEHSITIMKALRAIIAEQTERAEKSLLGHSDLENESYLFKAACSELRTEIQNARKVASEKMRTERTHLQHEVDILNQKMTQENLTLKDELKGLFDDRKMAVRMEQKEAEGKLQHLHHLITIRLNSEARSEVESVRWLVTRRAATALAISALMILATLRYSKYQQQVNEQRANQGPDGKDGSPDNPGGGGGASGVPTGQVDGVVVAGEGLIVSEGGMSLG